MNTKFYFTILLLIVFATVYEVSSECTVFSIPDVALLPQNADEIIRALDSLPLSPELLEQIVATELEDLADIAKYHNSSLKKYEHAEINVLIEDKDGYTLETHEVTTEDGYILTLHRIPTNKTEGKTVFVFHGILTCAVEWVTVSKDNAIPYFLVSQGYDVWLGNARGTKYSRKHESISPDCAEFWDFSFHEIGYYDIPAMVDYVLKETGQKSLTYLGYSQGANTPLVLLSERPEYNKKFDKVITLAGFSTLGHLKSPLLRVLAENQGFLVTFLSIFGVTEIPSDHSGPLQAAFIHTVEELVCGNTRLARLVCSNLIFLLCGFDRANLDIENLPVMIGHNPSGSSTKQLVHYAQVVITDKFRQFDYGEDKNMKIYNQKTPPEYNLTNVEVPIALLYSNTDWIVSETDHKILEKQLTNVISSKLVPNYGHLDWIWSKNMKRDVHPILKDLLK